MQWPQSVRVTSLLHDRVPYRSAFGQRRRRIRVLGSCPPDVGPVELGMQRGREAQVLARR